MLQDSQILEIARRAGWVIITADLDFPRLLALTSTEGPGLILFRGGNYSDAEMQGLLDRVLTEVLPEIAVASGFRLRPGCGCTRDYPIGKDKNGKFRKFV